MAIQGLKLSSFFSGAGGLDLGFKNAGFSIIYANEFDKKIHSTLKKNFPDTELDTRSIRDIESKDVPDSHGIIGGPPCQSWSAAGAKRGINDSRGQLFHSFIKIIEEKQPQFFLAENVSGMLAKRNKAALDDIDNQFKEIGYDCCYQLLNTSDYGIAQDRKRVIFIGFREELGVKFIFPLPTTKQSYEKKTLKHCIYDLQKNAIPALDKNYSNKDDCVIPNHEYMMGGFSPIYMSRNRVRSWNQQSFTIQAGGRHIPIHPNAPKMIPVDNEKDKMAFQPGKEKSYRRLSIRECARIQTFPDNFIFDYELLNDGYKMIGNAVPVDFATVLANKIENYLV